MKIENQQILELAKLIAKQYAIKYNYTDEELLRAFKIKETFKNESNYYNLQGKKLEGYQDGGYIAGEFKHYSSNINYSVIIKNK